MTRIREEEDYITYIGCIWAHTVGNGIAISTLGTGNFINQPKNQ